jgi:predicted enzyme related to lactoylglutathione lyase
LILKELLMQARYVHTNLIAQNWQKIVDFYQKVFGCTTVVGENVLAGPWVAQLSGVPGAVLRLTHLRLPGAGDDGPTLEIIHYNHQADAPTTAVNRPGFGHIAFLVDDVKAAHAAVLAAGGGSVGEVIAVDLPGRGRLTAVYATDPEGNVIELQHWS